MFIKLCVFELKEFVVIQTFVKPERLSIGTFHINRPGRHSSGMTGLRLLLIALDLAGRKHQVSILVNLDFHREL